MTVTSLGATAAGTIRLGGAHASLSRGPVSA